MKHIWFVKAYETEKWETFSLIVKRRSLGIIISIFIHFIQSSSTTTQMWAIWRWDWVVTPVSFLCCDKLEFIEFNLAIMEILAENFAAEFRNMWRLVHTVFTAFLLNCINMIIGELEDSVSQYVTSPGISNNIT